MVQDGCRRCVSRRRDPSNNLRPPGAGTALLILICLLAAVLQPGRVEGSSEPLDVSSWIYPAFRTFELEGLVDLPAHRPWSRSEAEGMLDRVLRRISSSGMVLTPRQDFLLGRLREELQGKGIRPAQREDRPVWLMREGPAWAALDLSAGAFLRKYADEEKGRLEGEARPGFLFDTGKGLSAGTTYLLRMRPERDLNTARNKPSPRERSFRGLTSEYERGWVAWRRGRMSFLVGRDYVHWGNGQRESLILSQQAGSLDQFSFDIRLGRFRLHNIQAVLDPLEQRHLAGHRLEVSLPARIRLGLSETVVYSGRPLDWSYLLPFGSYYANQYNENEDDNILWSVDWKVPLNRGLVFFGEFLVDDLQYENRGDAPDRLGLDLSVEGLLHAGAREVEFGLSYTWIDIFTYAHKDSLLTRYTAGSGSTADRILGSSLGPDSDRWEARISVPVTARILCRAVGSITRRGEGNDLREWVRGTDPDLPFPSGEVVEERDISFEVSMDLGRGSSVTGGAGFRSFSWEGGSTGDSHGYLGLVLDF